MYIENIIEKLAIKKANSSSFQNETTKTTDMLLKSLEDLKRTHKIRMAKSQLPKIKRKQPSAKVDHETTKKRCISLETSKPEFGTMKLQPLNEYEVPILIQEVETTGDDSELMTIAEQLDYGAKNFPQSSSQYVKGSAGLLHLERAAETVAIEKYNEYNISLRYTNIGRKFSLAKDVCNTIMSSIMLIVFLKILISINFREVT